MKNTTKGYFHDEGVHDLSDTNILVPIFMDLFKPTSVCDVGCGVGNFLYAFKEKGVKDVLGQDGAWVDKNIRHKYLEDSQFEVVDFETELPPRLRKFDLALCLEVGEHISDNNSLKLVNHLTRLSDTIIFSAAIPGQGGIGHINLQWEEYWEERFSGFGFKRYDIIRHKIFDNKGIRWWYRQNIVVYSKLDLSSHTEISYRNVCIKENYTYKIQDLNHCNEFMNGNFNLVHYGRFFLKIVVIKTLGFKVFAMLKGKVKSMYNQVDKQSNG